MSKKMILTLLTNGIELFFQSWKEVVILEWICVLSKEHFKDAL
jgi:hypothetical protein